MTDQFNAKVVVKSHDFCKTLDVWIRVKEALKQAFGKDAITLEFIDRKKGYDGMFHGEIFLYLTETKPTITLKEVEAKNEPNNRER